METVTVRMARGDRHTAWGFGVTEAPNRDVVIVNVVGGSLADRAGLRNGDVIDGLEGLDNLDINAVDRLLVTSRDKIELVVHRSAGGQARIWRPEITENRSSSGMFSGNVPTVEERPYRVSLEHNSDSRPPAGFNSAAMPFQSTDPRVKHLQYNSPMGLYSNANVAESYQQQTQGIVESQGARAPQNDQPAYLRSETLRLLKEQEQRGGSTLSTHPNPNGLPTCYVCTRPILGVMARAAGHEVHGDCLSCATCGNSLRNVGHHFLEGKFYCDIHGRQRKGLHPAGLDPNAAVRTAPTGVQPVRPTENVRAFYQPEVLQKRSDVIIPSPGQTVVQTHYGNPKTQGPISPSNRGVPTGTTFADRQSSAPRAVSPAVRPIQTQAPVYAPAPPPAPIAIPVPPVPSSAPPGEVSVEVAPHSLFPPNHESRVPSSIRSAVSPRRSTKTRQWPPPQSSASRYWQIDPAGAGKEKQKETSLKEMIDEESTEEPRRKKHPRGDSRRNTEIERPAIQYGIHWTVITGPKERSIARIEETAKKPQIFKPEVLIARTMESKCPVTPMNTPMDAPSIVFPKTSEEPSSYIVPSISFPCAEASNQPSATVVEVHSPSPLRSYIVPSEPRPLLHVTETTDSSTSPIPMITLERSRSVEHRRLPCTSSPVPFRISSPQMRRRPSPPEIRLDTRSPIEPSSELLNKSGGLIGINTVPRPFGSPRAETAKPLKKVDFSRVTEIPSPKWESSEIVDESDILTDVSRRSDEERELLRPYDGDESEVYDRSETTMDDMDEQEAWMREELEQARKEELAELRLGREDKEDREWIEYREEMRERQKGERKRIEEMEEEQRVEEVEQEGNGQEAREQWAQVPVRNYEETKQSPEFDHQEAEQEWKQPREPVRNYQEAPESSEQMQLDYQKKADEEWLQRQKSIISRPMYHYDDEPKEVWQQASRDPPHIDYGQDMEVEAPQPPPRVHYGHVTNDQRRHFDCNQVDEHQDSSQQPEFELNSESDNWNEEAKQEESGLWQQKSVESWPDSKVADDVDDWRQKAMELMLDESQTERDLAIVGALHERLQGLKELEESDRARAIECIERHQHHLEDQQDQLSSLLDCAILYLRNLDAGEEHKTTETAEIPISVTKIDNDEMTSSPPAPPVRAQQLLKTESLSDVLDELSSIRLPSNNSQPSSLSERLRHFANEDAGGSFSRSTFERSEKKETTGAANGSRAEGRGQGALTNPGGRIPYCEACKQQIRGAFVLATGLAWCPEHFVCANGTCGRRLLECGFVEENGQKFCEGCFEQHIAPKCNKCKKPIVADCLNALQKKWHPTCFTCAHCQKPFGNSAFYLENQLPYCEQDWNHLFTTKCVSCQYSIEAGDRWVEALGSAFHSNCFNCTRCHANLEGESFFAKNGQPFCRLHA